MAAWASLPALWLLAALAMGGLVPAPAFVLSLCLLAALWQRSGGRPLERFPDASLFLVLLAAYLSTFRWHGGDDAPNSLLPFCILRHGTLTLEPVLDPWFTGKIENFTVYHQGKHLSIFPVLPGLLALPLYVVPSLTAAPVSEEALHGLSKLSGALITAASALVLRRALLGRCSERFALTLALLYGLGTWAFSVSSQALWQHGPAALGAALGLWGFAKKDFRHDALAGFGLALAVAARPDSVFFLAAGGVHVLFFERRRLPGFALGAAVPLALLGAYWLAYTGRLRPPEAEFQARIFRAFQWDAFWGLLFSPTRGLFLFFPPAAFGVMAALRSRSHLTRLMVLACSGPWLLLCFYDTWVGGGTFGPRYFAVAALVLCWALAEREKELAGDPLWRAACVFAILVHAAGAYLLWPGAFDFPTEKATLWSWALHPLANVLTPEGSLRSLPLAVRALILSTAITLVSGFSLWQYSPARSGKPN